MLEVSLCGEVSSNRASGQNRIDSEFKTGPDGRSCSYADEYIQAYSGVQITVLIA